MTLPGWAAWKGEKCYNILPFRWLPACAHCYQRDQDKDASCGNYDVKGAPFCKHSMIDLEFSTLVLWTKGYRFVQQLLTINGEFQGQAFHTADRVLHQTAVDIIIHKQHPCKGQYLLVRRQQQASVVNQRLPAFRPAVCGLGSRVVRAVQSEMFSQFQNSGSGYSHIWSGYWLCGKYSVEWFVYV